jgi:hypothetical protein
LPEPIPYQPLGAREESVLPVAQAAVEAVDTAGTEVEALRIPVQTSAEAAAADRPVRARWALLRRRRSAEQTGDGSSDRTLDGDRGATRSTANSLPPELTESGV